MKRTPPSPRVLGDARKIVVSNQPLEFTWRNSEQLEGDLVEAVTALKNEPGDGNIGMSGSVSVVRQLLAAGLLDELHLLVHPIAVRKGMRLFDEGEAPIPLQLISSADLRDRCAEPRLRPGRVRRQRRLRGRQGPPAPIRTVEVRPTLTSRARGPRSLGSACLQHAALGTSKVEALSEVADRVEAIARGAGGQMPSFAASWFGPAGVDSSNLWFTDARVGRPKTFSRKLQRRRVLVHRSLDMRALRIRGDHPVGTRMPAPNASSTDGAT